jgi:hypothetical protein
MIKEGRRRGTKERTEEKKTKAKKNEKRMK